MHYCRHNSMKILLLLFTIFLPLCKSKGDSESGLSPSTADGSDGCPLGTWREKIFEMFSPGGIGGSPISRIEALQDTFQGAFQEVLEAIRSMGEGGEECASMIWDEMMIDMHALGEAFSNEATTSRARSPKPKTKPKSSTRSITLKGMMTAVGFNTEPPKFNESQVQTIFEGTGMSEMQKKMMMYIYSSVMRGNDKREKEKMAWIMSWQSMKNKETPTPTCQCPFCPEELCPGCSKNEIITIQGGSNRVFLILGQYKYDPKIQTYVQMTNTTEHYDFDGEDGDLMVAISSVYLYRVARSGWYVGLAPGKTKGMLYNPTNSSSLPTTGWQYWGPPEEANKGEEEEAEWGWVTDPSIKITNGSYNWCNTIFVRGQGGPSLDCELFGKFTRSPDWVTGRPVYTNDHGTVLHSSSGQEWKLKKEDKGIKITLSGDEPMSSLDPVNQDVWVEEESVIVTSTCSLTATNASITSTSVKGKMNVA